MKQQNDEEKRKPVQASVSAAIIDALAPLMREVHSLAYSEFAFWNQIDSRGFGSYVIPTKNGVIIAALDHTRFLAVHDPEGRASEPMKFHCPDAMLDALRQSEVSLVSEDGARFGVPSPFNASRVLLTDIVGLVSPSKDISEKHEGILGSWGNEDYSNVIRADSYRAEPADVGFINAMMKAVSEQPKNGDKTRVNPALLEPFTIAAKRLGIAVEMESRTSALVVRSTPTGNLFGVIATLKPSDETTDANLIEDELIAA